MYPASAADVNRRGHEISRKSRSDSSSRDHCLLLRRFAGDGCFAGLLATGKKRPAVRRYPATWSGMGEQSSGTDATGWCRKGKFQHDPSVVHAHCWLNWYLLSQERIAGGSTHLGSSIPYSKYGRGVSGSWRDRRKRYRGKTAATAKEKTAGLSSTSTATWTLPAI
jgi:hypothetical protein